MIKEVSTQGDLRLYVEARTIGEAVGLPDDTPVSYKGQSSLEEVMSGLAAFASQLNRTVESFAADKVTVQFGCEVGMETGQLFAIIGKAGAKSTIDVTLEWTKPQVE